MIIDIVISIRLASQLSASLAKWPITRIILYQKTEEIQKYKEVIILLSVSMTEFMFTEDCRFKFISLNFLFSGSLFACNLYADVV